MNDYLKHPDAKALMRGDDDDPYGVSEQLLHYSHDANLTLDYGRKYERAKAAKPDGLWLSVDNAWREWREGESWGIPDLEHVYQVILAPHASILRVTTKRQLRDLHEEFPRDRMDDVLPYYPAYQSYPSWPAMAEKYDGILIPSYHWDCRHDVDWYYGWDCASGCIWNVHAISAVRHVGTLARASGSSDRE